MTTPTQCSSESLLLSYLMCAYLLSPAGAGWILAALVLYPCRAVSLLELRCVYKPILLIVIYCA